VRLFAPGTGVVFLDHFFPATLWRALAPDILVQNRKEELQAGRDKALEKAIELLSE
jgi:hypothetical protein